MCAPLIPLVATGLGAIGTGISTAAAIGQARAQAAAANANALTEANAAQIGQQNVRQAALQQYQKIAQVSGEQRLLAAANGDAVNYGTPATMLGDTQILGNQDLARLYSQGNQNLIGADIGVANALGQASAANSRAGAGLAGGVFNLGTGLANGFDSASTLGSASQFGGFRAGLGL